jgi:sulfur-oxidizing protein SoxX
MARPFTGLIGASAVAVLLGGLAVSTARAAEEGKGMSAVEEGKKVAEDRTKGNCLACHVMAGGNQPGNIGPTLVAMKVRFPDKAVLRAQIWDATKQNPNSMMPPFGRHKVLTEDEVDKVVEYIYTL